MTEEDFWKSKFHQLAVDILEELEGWGYIQILDKKGAIQTMVWRMNKRLTDKWRPKPYISGIIMDQEGGLYPT